MTPEEKARIKIDQMFTDAGWKVVDRESYSPTLTAAAIREGLLEGNREADYFLFINGMAVGILEAKREEIDVTSDVVCEQAILYARGVPNYYKAFSRPLPIIYQSNGETTYFRDFRADDSYFDRTQPYSYAQRNCQDAWYRGYVCRFADFEEKGITRLPIRSYYRIRKQLSRWTKSCIDSFGYGSASPLLRKTILHPSPSPQRTGTLHHKDMHHHPVTFATLGCSSNNKKFGVISLNKITPNLC